MYRDSCVRLQCIWELVMVQVRTAPPPALITTPGHHTDHAMAGPVVGAGLLLSGVLRPMPRQAWYRRQQPEQQADMT